MMPQPLRPVPLARDAFAPFGDVIETDGAEHFAINNGTTERYHDLAPVELGGGRALINIFVGQPFQAPIAVSMMERHPLGSQAFFPLDARPFLVAVAPDDGTGSPADPVLFRAEGCQGVSYRAGTWHHPLISLDAESRFLVVDRGGPGDNLEERQYRAPGFVIETTVP